MPSAIGGHPAPAMPPPVPAGPARRTSAWAPEAQLTIGGVIWSVWSARWVVASVTLATLALAGAYLLIATPLYQASAVVQVLEDREGAPLGLKNLVALLPEASRAQGETNVIRSRKLLGGVVAQLGMDVEARPRFLPLIGAAVARHRRAAEPAAPLPGLERFAWGGEAMESSVSSSPRSCSRRRSP